MHFGKITFDVDERGEVGLLTRNIKIQASADAEQSFFGGHIMAMPSSKMYVEGVELNRMGQNLTLARYPIHWHLVGDAQGPVHQERRDPRHLQPLRDRARHELPARREQRDLQHRRSLLLPRRRHRARQRVRQEPGDPDQVPYVQAVRPDQPRRERRDQRESPGHQAMASSPQGCPAALGQHGGELSGSPIRTTLYRDNVAAGSDSNGFWMSLPEHPNGQFEGTEISKNTWPRRTPFREFKGNVAHSNYDAFMFDRNIMRPTTRSV